MDVMYVRCWHDAWVYGYLYVRCWPCIDMYVGCVCMLYMFHCADDRSVAVIDGTSLLFTPLARMVMPPPMSDHQLVLSSPIVSLSFYDHDMMI